MDRPKDDLIPSYTDANGREYYSQTLAAKYLGMTVTGFRRKLKKMEEERKIVVPIVKNPGSQLNLIDKRLLEPFRELVPVSKEEEWYEELRALIIQIDGK